MYSTKSNKHRCEKNSIAMGGSLALLVPALFAQERWGISCREQDSYSNLPWHWEIHQESGAKASSQVYSKVGA